jgi:hypothetical protein
MSATQSLPRLPRAARIHPIFRGLALVLIAVFGGTLLLSTRAAAGQVIAGFYSVITTTDLGPDERVTLNIRLHNSGDDKVFVTGVRLRGFSRPGQGAQDPVSVIIAPHGRSSFTQEFTMSKKEYGLWDKGVQPHISLNVQIGGNAVSTLTIALMRRPG